MKRYIFATILILLAIELAIITPLLLLTSQGKNVIAALNPTPTPVPSPVLILQGTPPAVHSTSAYLIDADTGKVLVNVNSQQRLPMASTTKIMTALLTIQKANLEQVVTIKQDATDEVTKNQGSTAFLHVGDQVRLKDLLYALLIPSGDDAAIAVATAVSGSPANFVREMNNYAHQLHLNQTHFINPDGLTYMRADGKPDMTQFTSAVDLTRLTRVALHNALFAQIVQTQHYILPATSAHRAYDWQTTDDLLAGYPGAIGVKTGFTEEAGPCLVFAAISVNHHVIGVLLQEKNPDTDKGKVDRFTDAKALLDWALALPEAIPTPVA